MAPPPPSASQQNPPTPPAAPPEEAPTGAAKAALGWVQDGMTLGLGTGRAASAFVEALGARVADGLQITGVPTSKATAKLAEGLGIPPHVSKMSADSTSPSMAQMKSTRPSI